MTARRRQLRASAGLGLLVLAALALFGLATSLVDQRPVLVVCALGLAGAVVALAQPALRRWLLAPQQLHDAAALLLHAPLASPLPAEGGDPALQGLAGTLQGLARQRDQLQADIDGAVAQASRGVAEERNRLAALMRELRQSVVVCNLDGQVLLYNQRALQQVQALADGPLPGGAGAWLGLGRSIHAVLDRALVDHALDTVRQRLARGDGEPSAQFVTVTRGGQLLRVQLAPVQAAPAVQADTPADRTEAGPDLAGYVLVFDNITRSHAQEAAQDARLQALTEGSRGSLANLQAACEMLGDADLPPALRERFIAVIRDETEAMVRRLHATDGDGPAPPASRWPLDTLRGTDVVQAACQAMAQAVPPTPGDDAPLRCGTLEVDAGLWLRLDSFALLQALCGLARRLHGELDTRTLHLRLQPAAGGRAHLDLVWTGQAMSTETVMGWELDSLDLPPGLQTSGPPPSVRDVVQRHGGAFWFERDRVRHQAFFRFLLPQAEPEAPPPAPAMPASPPDTYDFSLLGRQDSGHALDNRPLASLACTVFDTETTGLQPGSGDRILQLGAVRIVNGRLLRGETFDQLIDPGRDIPAASTAIHGITAAMVAGRPGIAQVLPAFHAFAADTVLVAHNAAFDLAFLQGPARAAGLRFDQPVIDTLLLSSVVHPDADSHALEAVAARLGVAAQGRHTALGDALVTAEVLLRLLPLAAGMGLQTLGQVRAACLASPLAT